LDKGANIEATLDDGATVLCISAQNEHPGIVKLLLDKGATTEAAMGNGATALSISAQDGHPDIVKLLLDKGANKEATMGGGVTALYRLHLRTEWTSRDAIGRG